MTHFTMSGIHSSRWFSFQDRVRAGAISAKLPVSQWLQEADKKNKPILVLQWMSDIS